MNDYLFLKRLFDFVFSSIVFIIISPFFIFIILLLILFQGFPIFFLQERIGKDLKVFKIIKFRTMIKNAINTGPGLFTNENDNRITLLGKVLRKFSIDEFPQFINVLRGDMSIVGPRPPVTNYPKYISEYNDKEKIRFSVLPGLTGLAQISGRNDLTWEERFKYDYQYIKKMNFNFDLYIIIKSVFYVLSGRGIY